MHTLEIRAPHVALAATPDKPIVKGLDLVIRTGEVHAIMGPNGTGKSTLSKAIAGHPDYAVTRGDILLDGASILAMEPDERVRASPNRPNSRLTAFRRKTPLPNISKNLSGFAALFFPACKIKPNLQPNLSIN